MILACDSQLFEIHHMLEGIHREDRNLVVIEVPSRTVRNEIESSEGCPDRDQLTDGLRHPRLEIRSGHRVGP